MKQIPISRELFVLVDDEDYTEMIKWHWHIHRGASTRTWYARRSIRENGKKKHIFMHRQLLGLDDSDLRQVDHVNHEGWDNRRENIRIVSRNQNHWNQKNVKGYWRYKRSRKYATAITVNGERIHLGYFDTAFEAREAYLAAKRQYHVLPEPCLCH